LLKDEAKRHPYWFNILVIDCQFGSYKMINFVFSVESFGKHQCRLSSDVFVSFKKNAMQAPVNTPSNFARTYGPKSSLAPVEAIH